MLREGKKIAQARAWARMNCTRRLYFPAMETWSYKRRIYAGPIIGVEIGEAVLGDGTRVHREVVRHSGGVGVAAVHEGCVVLVRQHRIALGKDLLEVPAGRLEPGDDPESRARTELEEEVGLRANKLEHVASCYCSPGFTDEMDHLFIAAECTPVPARPEFDEVIEAVRIPLDEVPAMLDGGGFADMKTHLLLRELVGWQDAQD